MQKSESSSWARTEDAVNIPYRHIAENALCLLPEKEKRQTERRRKREGIVKRRRKKTEGKKEGKMEKKKGRKRNREKRGCKEHIRKA